MSLKLYSDRLEVTLAEPGAAPNTTVRFDRAGFITQVKLDGKHTFCGQEPHNLAHPCSGGVGLCNEFRCMQPFDGTSLGDFFMKPGIGLMQKQEQKFFFYLPYPVHAFEIEISKTGQGFKFDTLPMECDGYALRHTKIVEVAGNRINMRMVVENTGQREIEFDEYCHNFLSIDEHLTGPNYRLEMPVLDQTGKPLKSGTALLGIKNGFTFSDVSEQASLVDVPGDEIRRDMDFAWNLSHQEVKAGVTGKVSFAPDKVTVWACGNVVSPQTHVSFLLQPGQQAQWERSWTFWDEADLLAERGK